MTRRHEVPISSAPSKITCPSPQSVNPRLSSLNPRTGNMNPSAQSSNSSGFVEASGTPKTLSGAPDRKMIQMSVFSRVFQIEKDGRPKVNSDVIWQAVWPGGRPGQNAGFRNRNVKTSTRNTSPRIQISSFRIQSSHPSRSGSTCIGGLSEIHEQLELGLWVLELRLWVLRITFRLLGLALRSLGLALFVAWHMRT